MIEITNISNHAYKLSGSLTRFDSIQGVQLPQVNSDLVIDLTHITVDTAGLAWLLKQSILFAKQGHCIKWQNPSKDLCNLASITGVTDILGI